MKSDEESIIHDNVDEVGVQGGAKLGSLLDELSNVDETECESCAI